MQASRGEVFADKTLSNLITDKIRPLCERIRNSTSSPGVSCMLQLGSHQGAQVVPIFLTPSNIKAIHQWPIPEACSVNRYTETLPKRHALPRLTVALKDENLLGNSVSCAIPNSAFLSDSLKKVKELEFPYDSYAVELCQTGLQEHNDSHKSTPAEMGLRSWVHSTLENGCFAWSSVFVQSDRVGTDIVPIEPILCGMIRARRLGESFDDGRIGAELLLFPHNFASLIPLIDIGREYVSSSQIGKVHFSQQWQLDMKKYTSTVPAYTYPALSSIAQKYQLMSVIPSNSHVPMFAKKLRIRLERLYELCCAELVTIHLALRDNKMMSWSRQLENVRCDYDESENNHSQETFEKRILFTARPPKNFHSGNNSIDISCIVDKHDGMEVDKNSPFSKPLYNGSPDVVPWPITPLATFKEINGGNVESINELFPLETSDLLQTWESMRRDLFGGGGSLATRSMTVNGIPGSGGYLRHKNPVCEGLGPQHTPESKQNSHKATSIFFDDDTIDEWKWWFRSCGSSRAPILTVDNCLNYLLSNFILFFVSV